MNNGLKIDVLIAALILSVAGHLGIMYWVEPKVMTHVNTPALRSARRDPMTVRRADTPADPVKFDLVQDLPAPKEAPAVDDTPLAAPVPDGVAPMPVAELPVPAAVDAPQVLERLRPSDDAPLLPETKRDASAEPETFASMPLDVSVPKPALVAAGGPVASGTAPVSLSAPSFTLPKPAPILPVADPVADEPAKLLPREKPDSKLPAFKPIDEVMPAVDEKIVAEEKAAVREMVNAATAADLAEAVDVSFRRHDPGDGYVYFKAVVKPKEHVPVVPKDVVILIDASGSIGNDRLSSCRKAARRILRTCTNTGDRFNLVAFRDKFSYAFKTWRPCDAESFDVGDRWLKRLAAHGRTDVFATIASVLTLPRDPARPLIALVVTDGVANEGVRGTAQIISRFAKLNDGLVSVYMYGVKSAANRELIDVLTRANRGESFIYDGWRWSAGSDIEKLSERFRDPLVTDLRVVFPTACPAEAYPRLLKNVYRGNTVEITGRVPKGTKEAAFSLKGLSGARAYEAFFRQSLATAFDDPSLPAAWAAERAIDRKLR